MFCAISTTNVGKFSKFSIKYISYVAFVLGKPCADIVFYSKLSIQKWALSNDLNSQTITKWIITTIKKIHLLNRSRILMYYRKTTKKTFILRKIQVSSKYGLIYSCILFVKKISYKLTVLKNLDTNNHIF